MINKYIVPGTKPALSQLFLIQTGNKEDYMEKIIWNESFSVGIPLLDSQHMELIRIINKMIDAKDVKVGSETISEILLSMTNYAMFHFKTEEDFLREHGYPEFESHKKEHTGFRKQTLSFCMDTMDNKNTIPDEILAFLKDWLLHHILVSDMQYKEFFKSKGV